MGPSHQSPRVVAFLIVGAIVLLALGAVLLFSPATAQTPPFHNAPAEAAQSKNPYADQPEAAQAGANLYAKNCSSCHGNKGQGIANIPALAKGPTQRATDGEIFWYITKGDVTNGMPAWARLPENQRWQLISYLKALSSSHPPVPAAGSAPAPGANEAHAPLPPPPFTDYRFEKPGVVHKITVADLPAPFATPAVDNSPSVVPRPAGVWPKAPAGFVVQRYATGLHNPRLITTALNGDFFVAESDANDIKVFRGISPAGKAKATSTFATGLHRPYGIAFYPPGPDPQWVYVGNTDSVVRFPYHNGDLQASGPSEHIADFPGDRGHWSRPVIFSPDGKKMYVAVGSASNVDDPDTSPAEKDRADVLEFNPDGFDMRIYAYGLRNCGGGIAINSKTGELWCSTNERDGLGDNLVPDYITHVEEGGFYGWPWWYMGGHQDPRLEGKHPELKDKVITPDVILQPHNASLGITFYDAHQFPAKYYGDLFAAEHGSWNRSVRAGYEVIRVPLRQTGHATGEYQDFVTGFVLPDGNAWGRPVGVTVAQDGSLLVTDDGSNSIWRIVYVGMKPVPSHPAAH